MEGMLSNLWQEGYRPPVVRKDMVNLVGMGQIWKGQKKKKIVRNGVQKDETQDRRAA